MLHPLKLGGRVRCSRGCYVGIVIVETSLGVVCCLVKVFYIFRVLNISRV